jgi:arabinogalactan endo-1,4-beta-galactosidase
MRAFLFISFNFLLLTFFISCKKETAPVQQMKHDSTVTPVTFYAGADLSFQPQEVDGGALYYDSTGAKKTAMEIFQEGGFNYVRLRIWNNPSDGYCGLQKTLAMAAEAKSLGMHIELDFHYSDTWADPGHQTPPAAWASNNISQMNDSVYSYTKTVIAALKAENALPDIVQTGNEITDGMLWPLGQLNGDNTTQWSQLTTLLKSASSGVKAALTKGDSVQIMIHLDRSMDLSTTEWFFDHLKTYSVPYDIIGQSYYSWYHGTDLNTLQANLDSMALRYNKDVVLAETAFPFTFSYNNDGEGNLVGSSSPLPAGYAATAADQKSYLQQLKTIMLNIPNGHGKGIFYWAPDWVSAPTFPSASENCALFDFNDKALPAMNAWK